MWDIPVSCIHLYVWKLTLEMRYTQEWALTWDTTTVMRYIQYHDHSDVVLVYKVLQACT